jgi:micrococcal nuclease
MYEYRANVLRVIDGDTVDLEIDLGFMLKTIQRIRLLYVNTPELHAKDETVRTKAQAAKLFTELWCSVNKSVVIKTDKDDAFGRWLAEVYTSDKGECLNTRLLDTGNAVRYVR